MSFLWLISYNFQRTGHSPPWVEFMSRYFFLCDAFVNGIVVLISVSWEIEWNSNPPPWSDPCPPLSSSPHLPVPGHTCLFPAASWFHSGPLLLCLPPAISPLTTTCSRLFSTQKWVQVECCSDSSWSGTFRYPNHIPSHLLSSTSCTWNYVSMFSGICSSFLPLSWATETVSSIWMECCWLTDTICKTKIKTRVHSESFIYLV